MDGSYFEESELDSEEDNEEKKQQRAKAESFPQTRNLLNNIHKYIQEEIENSRSQLFDNNLPVFPLKLSSVLIEYLVISSQFHSLFFDLSLIYLLTA